MVFCYRHDGELVGYNICLEHGGMLIDKYIGLRYPQARELDLYFVSWFVNLEHALERGLRFYVAGWTDPEVKAGLGARFTFTRHLVWVNPILRRILYMFRHCLSPTQRPWARRRLIRIRIMHDPRESFRPSPPVILDFDGSVLPVAEGERRIPLGSWQEAIRFGCTRRAFSALEAHLEGVLPVDCGCAFMGSGDFHHVTLIPLRRLCRRLPPASLDVVVFDNHPDNMRYPFGIHCGSWVSHAALQPSVRRVHVIGITSGDIGLAHAWENRLTPFLRRKLTYWSVGTDARGCA